MINYKASIKNIKELTKVIQNILGRFLVGSFLKNANLFG
jgi:hypothetical protein